MITLWESRFALGISAITLLAGCGGSQPPITAPRGPSSAALHKGQSLLYISDEQAGDVYIVELRRESLWRS